MTSIHLCMLLLVMGIAYVAPAKYNVEIYFVVDEQAVKSYQGWGYKDESLAQNQLKKELFNNLDDVNIMYKTLKTHGLDIQMRVSGLKFASNNIYSDGVIVNKTQIDKDRSLRELQKYLKGNKISNFDLAVLITGYDVIGKNGNSGVTGASDLGTICKFQYKRILVTEVAGHSGFTLTLAHEVAHALGAEHDGVKNKCKASDWYIMAPSVKLNVMNRWTFSPCTATFITNFIKSIEKYWKNCLGLDETNENALTPTKKEKDPLEPEKICQRKLGDKGYMCMMAEKYGGEIKGDRVCREMFCRGPNNSPGKCSRHYPPEGMICDAGKRCKQGKCVTAPKNFPVPNNIDTDCVYGDTKNPKILTDMAGGCATVIPGNKRKCYEKNIKIQCCASCKRVKTNIRGCEYGDKADGCDRRDLRNSCSGSKRKICCETCRNYRG